MLLNKNLHQLGLFGSQFDTPELMLPTRYCRCKQELPGVEFPEAKVQFFESPDEEPAAVDPDPFVVELRVQDEHWVELLAVSESSHQRWVVMQPESLAEPVNGCMTHFC